MLIVYVPKLTNRVGYTLKVLLHTLLHINFEITTDSQVFIDSSLPKLCYGPKKVGDSVWIESVNLLFQTNVDMQDLHFFDFNGSKAFYPVYDRKADFPFDMLSAAFFCLSRYEEFLPHRLDQHGRFMAKESVAYQKGFLQEPLVDQWAQLLGRRLEERFPDFKMEPRHFSFTTTIDIDAAYCYRQKGIVRTLLGVSRDVVGRRDWNKLKQRIRVLMGKEPDPFDTFDDIIGLKRRYNEIPLIFFVLVGSYDTYDKCINPQSEIFRQLLKHLGDYAKIGLHTSYAAFDDVRRMDKEKECLEQILNRSVVRNRSHFLRMQLPETYGRLIHAGITDDYTMGYAEEAGFRASISVPYPFFNLVTDSETGLTIHPFVLMDATLKRYLGLTTDEAWKLMKSLMDKTAQVQGEFCGIWHNENLCEQFGWEGWKELYQRAIEYGVALKHGNVENGDIES